MGKVNKGKMGRNERRKKLGGKKGWRKGKRKEEGRKKLKERKGESELRGGKD